MKRNVKSIVSKRHRWSKLKKPPQNKTSFQFPPTSRRASWEGQVRFSINMARFFHVENTGFILVSICFLCVPVIATKLMQASFTDLFQTCSSGPDVDVSKLPLERNFPSHFVWLENKVLLEPSLQQLPSQNPKWKVKREINNHFGITCIFAENRFWYIGKKSCIFYPAISYPIFKKPMKNPVVVRLCPAALWGPQAGAKAQLFPRGGRVTGALLWCLRTLKLLKSIGFFFGGGSFLTCQCHACYGKVCWVCYSMFDKTMIAILL